MRSLFLIAVCAVLVGCSDCSIGNVRDFPSPDGKHVATTFDYYCGDTTGGDTYVDLHRAGTKMQHGNVMRVTTEDRVAVTWASPAELTVRYYYAVSRTGPAPTNIDGIAVKFKLAPELDRTRR